VCDGHSVCCPLLSVTRTRVYSVVFAWVTRVLPWPQLASCRVWPLSWSVPHSRTVAEGELQCAVRPSVVEVAVNVVQSLRGGKCCPCCS